MAAPKSKLAELHEMLAEVMLEDLRQSIVDKIPLPAANLGVIRQFLKDNEITATADADDMKQLRDEFRADLDSKREQRKRVANALSDDAMGHILQ
ncbi:putative DNA maturase A [Pectobacterium phage PPWS2]|uniref:Putative DNA maturase A n=1 Tax=Pectobacterium phage PPWS2 TaxID=2153295 RepID=A0A3G9DXI3_9CAUD|nr:terminase small subunit [Pectobacterium phage PPWS2]BBD74685.1 putative DNA maturase A [Pectobacterium phage PPWS2]